ncbi:MAG: hypothetical protein AAF632_16740 [Bacteroidota bacterium]
MQNWVPTYEVFAEASLVNIYGEAQLEAALEYQIDTFASGWLEKTDDGLIWHTFPNEAQLSSINTIASSPTNSSSNQQFIVAGNLYTSEVETPRNDAGYGIVLQSGPTGVIWVSPILVDN